MDPALITTDDFNCSKLRIEIQPSVTIAKSCVKSYRCVL